MTNTLKNILTVVTFLPIIAFLYGILGYFQAMSSLSVAGSPNPGDLNDGIYTFMKGTSLAFVLNLILMVYYIILAVQNKKIDSNERLMWILLFIFTYTIGFLVYLFTKIEVTDDNN